MRIDLHCHTKKVKSGDNAGRNVSTEMFAQKIMNANVKIAAITNHNHFDADQFFEFSKKVEEYCQIWPGIELDIAAADGSKWHLLVITDNKYASDFSRECQLLLAGKNIETVQFEFIDVYNHFEQFAPIYIAHYHKKPGISEEEYKDIIHIVGDASRVFCEAQNPKSHGIFANHEMNAMIGSDIKNWNDYENSHFSELRLEVDSFEHFKLLSKRDPSIVETLLCKNQTHTLQAVPHSTNTFNIKLYNEVNIIFGQKGTGKTEIIKSLCKDMEKKQFNCVTYIGQEKDDEFNSFLRTDEMKREAKELGLDDCSLDFEHIKNWSEKTITPFSRYVEWKDTSKKANNKKALKATNSKVFINLSDEKYKNILSDKNNLFKAIETLKDTNMEKYLEKSKLNALNQLLDELSSCVNITLFDEYVEFKSQDMTNKAIDNIKKLADKKTNTVSRPSKTGFSDIAKSRLGLKTHLINIMDNLVDKESFQDEYLGSLEDKGNVYIRRKHQMLCKNSRKEEFINAKKCKSIRALRVCKSNIESIYQHIFSENISSFISEFDNHCSESNIDSINDFVGLSCYIINESETEYNPSSGERGMLTLQKILKTDADAYFLDEPELGMGNSYIDSTIRPAISNLGKERKMVVIATHNANIAVRTLPYLSLFRSHENGNYKTYIGNPFTDLLINIDDDKDTLKWSKESMHTLEGGNEAFYNRKEIYESGS